MAAGAKNSKNDGNQTATKQTETSENDRNKRNNNIPNNDLEVSEIPEAEPIKNLQPITYKREDTRGRLALVFVIGFFIILFSSLVLAGLSEGDKVEAAKEIMLVVSGILSGALGFVIGYYFRSTED